MIYKQAAQIPAASSFTTKIVSTCMNVLSQAVVVQILLLDDDGPNYLVINTQNYVL